MGAGTIGGVDGGQAFKSACLKAASTPLEGVRHVGNVFTPLVRLQKKNLPTDVKKTLTKTAQASGSCVLERRSFFYVVAGNNAAEGAQGHINNTLRRLGQKAGPNLNATIGSLAAAALLRRPGFDAVLEAVNLYRDDLLKGDLKVNPKDAFSKHPKWLPSPEPVESMKMSTTVKKRPAVITKR
jgi:hypothetical protein